MSKVEIDVTANTSQAEQAITALTRDVDKLQQKAKQTTQLGKKGEYKKSDVKKDPHEQKRARVATQTDKSAEILKNTLSSVADKLGGFGKQLEQTSDGFFEFYGKLRLITQDLPSLFGKLRMTDSVGFARNSRNTDRHLNNIRTTRTRIAEQRASNDAARRMLEDGSGVTSIIQANSRKRRLANLDVDDANLLMLDKKYRQMEIGRRNALHSDAMYGPLNGPINSGQRFNRGLMQWGRGGRVGTPGFSHYRDFSTRHLGMNTTRLSGLGNIARGGAGLALRGMGLTGVGAGITAGGLAAGATLSALAAPSVAFGASMSYANNRVDQGRVKADEYTKLNTQLSQLTKNLSGGVGSAAALSKEIQDLGVKGITPMEGLSRGASMLMLAFKGNQQETSKWLNILADMSAGTGESVEFFSELITRANQFGNVEFEVFNQLNEKGIPILDQLQGKFGETREEIEAAAREGKITAAEFMKAFEAAHKVSMEGANIAQKTSTLTGIREQTAEYEQLEAANYTRGYDARMMDYEKWRNQRAEERAIDESLIAQGEILGSVLASLTSAFKTAIVSISDAGDWFISKFSSWTGLTDAQAGLNVSEMSLFNTGTRVMEDGINHFAKEGDPDRYYSSAQLSSAISEVQHNRDRLQRIATDEDFDEDVRNKAAIALKEADELLSNLQSSYEAAVEREQKLAEAREEAAETARKAKEAEDTRAAFMRDMAKTDKEMLNAAGFDGLYDVTKEMENIASRIKAGEGSAADRERYDELSDLSEAVTTFRNNEKEKAEEEARKRREEELRLSREERAREMYRMERDIQMNPDDPERKFAYELEVATDKLKALGFSADEASEMLTENRAYQIQQKEKEIEENNKQIAVAKEEIGASRQTGLGMETNAWGSTGNLYTNFTNPVDEQQLKELEKVNNNLEAEIQALNRLDIRAYAQ